MVINPEYKKWLTSLKKEARENYFSQHYYDDEYSFQRIRDKFYKLDVDTYLYYAPKGWICDHPMPEKEIQSPEEQRIAELEKELEKARIVTADDVVSFFKDKRKLNLRQIADIAEELVVEYVVYNKYHGIDKAWFVSEEDEHLYTDKGLEVPFEVPGRDSELYWLLTDVCWRLPGLINKHLKDETPHIDKYYQDIEKDIENKLKENN